MREGLIVTLFVCLLQSVAFSRSDNLVIGFLRRTGVREDQAVYHGAQNRAEELAKQSGQTVQVIESQYEEFPQEMQAIQELHSKGVRAFIMRHPSGEAQALIQYAKDNGLLIVTYGGDQEVAGVLASFGPNNVKCGRLLMTSMAKEIGGKGLIAIFGGVPGIPALDQRVQGVKEEAEKYPNIDTIGPLYSTCDPREVSLQMEDERTAHHDLRGWLAVIDCAIFNQSTVGDPGAMKVAVVDPGVDESLNAVRDRYVQVLLVQTFYEWGVNSVGVLYNKIVKGQNPEHAFIATDPVTVTHETLEEFSKRWNEEAGL